MVKLQRLRIGDENGDGKQVPNQLFKLTRLTALEIQLDERIDNRLQVANFSKLSQLKTMSLLGFQTAHHFPDSLYENLTQLTELELLYCSGVFEAGVPTPSFSQLCNLRRLSRRHGHCHTPAR